MAEYLYKGFKIFYEVAPYAKNLYQAQGEVKCSVKHATPALSKKFHTEGSTGESALSEIKKLMERYIDFEWQQFHRMSEEINK